MREIKFRVWDIDHDSMIAVNVGIDKIYLYDFEGDGITEQEGLVIMQYTGLKDKNGKEIYEGDICIGSRFWCDGYLKKKYPKEVKLYLQVIWYGAGFSLKQVGVLPEYVEAERENDYRSYGYSLEDLNNDGIENSVEVIGNIHENAEILK